MESTQDQLKPHRLRSSDPTPGSRASVSEIHCEVVSSEDGFLALEEAWDDLLSRSPAATVFLTWSWQFSWWSTFGRSRSLYLVLFRQRERLIGIAPLYRARLVGAGLPGLVSLRLIGSEHVGSDYLDLILEDGKEGLCWTRLLEHLRSAGAWTALELHDIRRDSKSYALLERWAGQGHRLLDRGSRVCPYAPLPDSWEDYLQQLSSSRRYDVRRKSRKLAKQGEISFSMLRPEEDLQPQLDAFVQMNRERLQRKGIHGGFIDPGFDRFHRAVMPRLHDRGQLRLCFLDLSGEKIAGLYLMKYGDRYYYYQAGMQSAWNRFSPGSVLFANAIRYGIEHDRVTEFDFLRGREAFKFGWAREIRTTATLQLFNESAGGRLAWHLLRGREAIKRGLRRRRGDGGSKSNDA